MSRHSHSTSTSSQSYLDNLLSAPKPQRVPSPNLLLDDPIARQQLAIQLQQLQGPAQSQSQSQSQQHVDIDEYPSVDSSDLNFDTVPAFHTSSSAFHSRNSSMTSTSSHCHYVVNDELDEDFPSTSSISITNLHQEPSISMSSTKRPSSLNRHSRPPSRSSWISVHLNTAIQAAVKRNSTKPEPVPIHTKRSSIDASASAEIRSIIFARCDDDEEDSFGDAATAASGIACSPPMRTHNPLIRDTLFSSKPTPILAGASCATSIGSPSLTSIGSPGLQYSLAAALSKQHKGHDHKGDSELSTPRDITGASTNGGRSILQFSPPPTPGITAQ